MTPTNDLSIPLAAATVPARSGTIARLTGQIGANVLPAILVAATILAVWQIAVTAMNIPTVVLPSPVQVAQAVGRAFPLMVKQAVPTALEAVGGFLLAAGGGIALATLLASSQFVRSALYPSILFFQLIPKIALAPLFILWFGIGSSSRLSFIVFISFFPTVLAALTGLLSTPPEMLRLCRACNARARDIYLYVRMPYAVPILFSGLKISATFAIIGVVVGEFISAQAGLGYLILFASSQADTPLALAAIAMLCVLGLALYGSVAWAEAVILARLGEQRRS